MYVVCREHVDMAIDEFIEEYLQVPDLYLLKELYFSRWKPGNKCEFCNSSPEYLVI